MQRHQNGGQASAAVSDLLAAFCEDTPEPLAVLSPDAGVLWENRASRAARFGGYCSKMQPGALAMARRGQATSGEPMRARGGGWLRPRFRPLLRDGRVVALAVSAAGLTAPPDGAAEAAADGHDGDDQLQRTEEFLALVAYQLKGPLHVLGMLLGLLESRALRGQPPDASAIDRGRRQVRRLQRIIDELADLCRLQRGGLELVIEEVELGGLLRQAMAAAAGPRLGSPELVLPESPLVGRWDRARLERLLCNLLENAFRHAPAGALPQVRVASDEQQVVIEVQDAGPGIAPRERGRIFERFARPTSQGQRGLLGVGLHIGRAVARAHGGELEIVDGKTAGACLRLTLPRRSPAGSPQPDTPARLP